MCMEMQIGFFGVVAWKMTQEGNTCIAGTKTD